MAAREQDPVARAAWWGDPLDPDLIVNIDETSTNIAMLPHCAWAPLGERAHAEAPARWGDNVTLVASFTTSGPGPAMVIRGALTIESFLAYLERFLVPSLRPGQIVVLDNLNVHRHVRVREVIEAAGCTVRYLPPYSPDFAPIEHGFAKLKGWLRTAAARTFDALVEAIGAGLRAITAADARGCFRGCGYAV